MSLYDSQTPNATIIRAGRVVQTRHAGIVRIHREDGSIAYPPNSRSNLVTMKCRCIKAIMVAMGVDEENFEYHWYGHLWHRTPSSARV